MRIELSGQSVELGGDLNVVAAAALEALRQNGGRTDRSSATQVPDLFVASLPLLPGRPGVSASTLEMARRHGDAMQARGSGRIIFLMSAVAALPTRRQPEFSAEAAAALATMRGLAMRLGPQVLVNALGLGAIGDPVVAGDAAMLTHASLGRAGTLAEAVAGVLFLADPANTYTTGQMLVVDGGWSAGYGRNF